MKAIYLDTATADTHDGPALLEGAGFSVEHALATTDEEVIAAAEGATAILVGDSPISAAAITALPDLRLIASATVGTNHIDVAAARRHGVVVANVPDVVTEEVAVTTLALTLGLVRHTSFLDRSVREGAWDPFATGPRHRVSGMTLGLVGFGRIGRRVAELATPFFGAIITHDPVAAVTLPVRAVTIDELLEISNVVSLHIPAQAGQPPLIDAGRLSQMQTGAYLINVARGGLVDSDDLLAALDAGTIAGAAIDVLADEPPAPTAAIRTHPRIVVNPHAAFWSVEAEAATYAHQAQNVISWQTSGHALTPVQ
jgi:phosphoglycerate dehydrogenase-like enzyme